MKDFMQYIYDEVKSKRLGKADAIDLLHQFQSCLTIEKRDASRTRHPLLHQDISTDSEQRYRMTLTGEEVFLAEAKVNSRFLLGLIYLEMARAAAKPLLETASSGTWNSVRGGILFQNVIWAKPVTIGDQLVQLQIRLITGTNGQINYEIYGEPGVDAAKSVVYSQGSIVLSPKMEIPSSDLNVIRIQCSQKIFSAAKMEYNPFQGIETIYAGPGQVLAKLSLPAALSDTMAHFMLHPVIMNSAAALVGFMTGHGRFQPSLPVSLQELQIFKGCSSKMWALVQNSKIISNNSFPEPNNISNNGLPKFDIDLYDEQGTICIRMKEYSAMMLVEEANWETAAEPMEMLLLKAGWQESKTVSETLHWDFTEHWVVFSENAYKAEFDPEKLENQWNGTHWLRLQSKQKRFDQRFEEYAVQVFETIQSILTTKSTGQTLMQVVVPNQGEARVCVGLSGLLKTAGLENPKFISQLIEVDPDEDPAGIIAKLKENRLNPNDNYIRYQNGKRLVFGWSEIEISSEPLNLPWRDGGIYLITGGAGGLGQLFADEIAHQVKDSVLILTGRSPLSETKLSKLKELESYGAKASYRQVDVTDPQGVKNLIQSIQEEFGKLHGIIHCAGLIHDNFIIKKTKAEWHQVLGPKVTGLVNLDIASQDLNLDCFILFSSMSGSLGNAGQADYATANAFMDAYAGYRNSLVAVNQRRGKTLSINWPLWREGGMQISQESEKLMQQQTSMTPLRTETGIQAFYQVLASGQEQVMVMEGAYFKLKDLFLGTVSQNKTQLAKPATPAVDPERLYEKTLYQLKKLLGEVAKLEVTKIDSDEPLESYGIDSFMIIQLNPKLATIYGIYGRELSKTLFYENQTLGALTKYLITEFPQECENWTGLNVLDEPAVQPISEHLDNFVNYEANFPVLVPLNANSKPTQHLTKMVSNKGIQESIAIIGLYGHYPQAGTLQEYWQNLMAGRDCIIEIPEERWSLEGFYHPDPEEAVVWGKSYSKWGGFVEGFADFDPLFFNISPREAYNMDPQERLFIETCWEVLEDAGYTKAQLQAYYHGRVGVFAGITKTGFDLYGPDLWRQGESIFPHTSFSSVANRVSYLFNLQGPSMPVDTMCSASLTAIHEACEHLLRGECDLAIAGGVNLYLHPSSYIGLCSQQMLSRDGRCKSFAKDGNGFVPGEGVGVVLLKQLSRAVADQDQIYAIIRGTSINHGGKTNGYTVPNPNAQGELIRTALDKAGVNARTVSYIEAHGTGTELGDPIEITGLTQAFRKDTADTGFCAIGSVKTNIGHLEAAAGIAGLTKIILQMRHGQLVPSLHSKELNPNINFAKTPFVVQRELTKWKRPVVTFDGVTREYPRIAGISSFGAGGSNAHVVIEEYVQKDQKVPRITITSQQPEHAVSGNAVLQRAVLQRAIIVLSAKNEDRLREQARQLLAAIQAERFSDTSLTDGYLADGYLADIAYTLQTGREAMEERLAVIVGTIQELVEKLQLFTAGQGGIEDLYRGQVKRNQDTLGVFTSDEDMQKTIEAWITKKKYGKLLEFWVQGLIFDWNKLYGETKPRRISLPAYPFARERYWLPKIDNKSGHRTNQTITALIHPLLHQNSSDLSEQRFSSTFTGAEFFLADHKVNGKRVLPGVAYLEMVRAAVQVATGALEPIEFRLKNVVWARPIVVGAQPVRIHTGLFPEENSEALTYKIYSSPGASASADGAIEMYSQGSVVLAPNPEVPILDLKDIQARCSPKFLSPAEIYETFKMTGINYGPGYQGIEKVYIGPGQVLAKLALPATISDTRDQYILHPSMMDGALQASIGLMMGADDKDGVGSPQPSLPFALEELEIYSGCTSSMWAFIRSSSSLSGRYGVDGPDSKIVANFKADARIQKFDIDLCDDTGKVGVRLRGYSPRILDSSKVAANLAADMITSGRLLAHPSWKEQVLGPEIPSLEYARQLIILCELEKICEPESTLKKIEAQMDGVARHSRCLSLQVTVQDIDQRFQIYTTQVFEAIQSIFKDKSAGKVLVQIIIVHQGEQRLFSGLSGLIKTARLENPKLIGQLIEVEASEDLAGLVLKLRENGCSSRDHWIRYQTGKRYVACWDEIETPGAEAKIPWKDGGVYLITGGAGGLGMIFAKEIAQKVKKPALILTGRSKLSEERSSVRLAEFRELENFGAGIEYKSVDVTDKQAVFELIQSIVGNFGGLDGIIHSAGIIKDNFIIKKSQTEFLEVLAPKVTGLLNLDLASRDLPLDFLILFSSLAGSIGNPGQSDYAAANAFMNAYAGYRKSLVASNQRHGLTLAINWPLWQEGGMRVDIETGTMMFQNSGLSPLPTRNGIEALYQSFASGHEQVMVMEGDLVQIKRIISSNQMEVPANLPAIEENKSVPVIEQDLLHAKTVNYFKKVLSFFIKLPAHLIETDAPMEKYGIDSIMVMQLTNELEKTFGLLSKTLFFEYQTIRELTGYFLEAYRGQLIETLGFKTKTAEIAENSSTAKYEPTASAIGNYKHSRFGIFRTSSPEVKPNKALDIAVIGVSGRYPQARNIREFWRNLQEGKDCITEIPKERWNHDLYYDADKNNPGKTYSKWGGFLDGVEQFDPLFFNISPREAEYMDPQERLFLECVYETLEDAGYTREFLSKSDLSGNVGVYVGVMYEEYQLYGAQEQIQGRPKALSGNPSSIANRVSYFYNFHGPSLAVDTMCSSSLTAIHLACRSLQRDECKLAIAGGVNVSIHPNKYLMLAQGKFASSKGRCESFGEGGDGYVPGEGVGAVLLKPLADAITDGDQIYGLIKGIAVNHGGKTNGYTVPNPNAQAGVIGQALKEAGFDPRTISYIEAHGTGTSLGDPIEITGLTKAFREYTGDNQFCAIGSAKSNIGHCESAAGIAGVTKVLLQFKYGQLVPSIHSEVLNPNIDFLNSPFVVQRNLTEWKRPVIDGLEVPRRAGISSFGAGGSNAHIVIEEYLPKDREKLKTAVATDQDESATVLQYAGARPTIILLSAKNEDRLREHVRQLLAAIRERQFSDNNLADMAYTLQVGREAMEERLGLIVGSVKELAEKLNGFVEGREGLEDLYRGQVKRNQDTLAVFTADEELQEAIFKWIQRGKYPKLIDLWVKGLVFDWNKFYGDLKPYRISLPTYPFAKESYWIPEHYSRMGVKGVSITSMVDVTVIHPLLHRNTSDFSEQRFSSTFTGGEFFLADHVVNGWRVLPGVAYLEMARAAVQEAAGIKVPAGIKLKNIVWARPIVVDKEPVQVQIGLYPEANGEIVYEVYGQSETDGAEIIYSQGSAMVSPAKEIPALDIPALQAECNQHRFSSAEIYPVLRRAGFNYGPGYQGIEMIYIGRGWVLAKLSLPVSVTDTLDQYLLHPSIMDSALQAAIGFMMGDNTESKVSLNPSLPFALQELTIFSSCTPIMWALLHNRVDTVVADKVQKLDIDLSDGQGNICVRMTGYTSRVLEGEADWVRISGVEVQENPGIMINETNLQVSPETTNNQEAYELMTFEEVWQEESLPDECLGEPKTLVCFVSNPENQQLFIETMQSSRFASSRPRANYFYFPKYHRSKRINAKL